MIDRIIHETIVLLYMLPKPTAYVVMVDHALITRLVVQLEENTKALQAATEQLGNTRFYEEDAARHLGVEKKTMYHYRKRGLAYEKVGRIVSYRRKDLDEWRTSGRTQVTAIQ